MVRDQADTASALRAGDAGGSGPRIEHGLGRVILGVSGMDVIQAYRLLLGRQPESEQAVLNHMGHANVWSLVKAFVDTSEFKERLATSVKIEFPFIDLDAEEGDIEVDCSPEQLDILWKKVKKTWEDLGRERPHHSVVTNDAYLPKNLPQAENAFWQSGEEEAERVMRMLARFGFGSAANGVCCEFGAGVGRVTVPLSRSFGRVIAYDISKFHLDIAARRATSEGRDNISFVPLTEADTLEFSPCSFFYSRIVLQHNPPPIQKIVLNKALQMLAPGGVAIFQLPTYQRHYAFSVADYCGRDLTGDMEMHALPQHHVFEVADRTGCEVLEVREDNDTGRTDLFISNTFTVRKRGARV